MNVIPPISITDAKLTSSTVVEVAPAAYAGGTTYAVNDTVSVAGAAGLQTVYKSLQDSNTGHTPASSPTWWEDIGEVYQAYSGAATYAADEYVQDNTNHLVYQSVVGGNIGNALTDPAKWLEIGPTNKWAMFDLLRNTGSTQPSSMTVVLTPGERINAIALIGLVANSVAISATSGGSPVYSYSETLDTREVFDWYGYFFEPFSTKESAIVFDVPPYSNIVITITLTGTTAGVSCGGCVLGTAVYLGAAQINAESDVLNFSTVTRDDFGNSVLVPRRNVPKTNQVVACEKSRVNKVRAVRSLLNAVPAVWSALDDTTDDYADALLILGYYRRFSIGGIADTEMALLTLELEEV